jgi:hypothetical protein
MSEYAEGLLALKSTTKKHAAMGRPAKLAWRKAVSDHAKHPDDDQAGG